MAKQWKMPTQAIKTRALKLVKTYINTGVSLSKARLMAAKAVGYTPSTIANWGKQAQETPKTSQVTKTRSNTVRTDGFINSISVKSDSGAIVKLTVKDIEKISKLAGLTH